MEKVNFEYDKELDMLHVYSSEVKKGIKGCISSGHFTLDVSEDNKIIGIEIEEASKFPDLNRDLIGQAENISIGGG